MVKIGLEIHAYLNTTEKLFCACRVEHGLKHSKPNMNICPICTGQPGSKPQLPNSEAIKKTIQTGLILNCKINNKVMWKRKHYSWPDLPKGFQNTISGVHSIPNAEKGNFFKINIRECHMEEDPAAWNPQTGEVDYNRSGVPLIEIVTEPDFKNSEQVIEWIKQLIITLNYINSIDKKAGIKVDVNVSLPELKGERIEIKNINGLTNIKNAIEYEIERQKKPGQLAKVQETRMFDEVSGETIKMRSKEQAEDYRFISEPDLPLMVIEENIISKIKFSLPETPHEKLKKLVKKHKIEKKHAETLTKKLEIVEFFEKVIEKSNAQLAIHWVIGELMGVLNFAKKEMEEINIDPYHFVELLDLIETKSITKLKAKEILRKFIPKSFSPSKILKESKMISDHGEIGKLCKKIVENNKKAVQDFKAGKDASINYLVGQAMILTKKRADFKEVREILKKLLGK